MQGPAKDQAGSETVLHKVPGRFWGSEIHADQESAPPYSREASCPAEGLEFAQKLVSFALGLSWQFLSQNHFKRGQARSAAHRVTTKGCYVSERWIPGEGRHDFWRANKRAEGHATAQRLS